MKINVSRSRLVLLLLMGGAMPTLAGYGLDKNVSQKRDSSTMDSSVYINSARANQQFMYALNLAEQTSTLSQGIDQLRIAVQLYQDLDLVADQAVAELALVDHLIYRNMSGEAQLILDGIDEAQAPSDLLDCSRAKLYYASGDFERTLTLTESLLENASSDRVKAEAKLLSIYSKYNLNFQVAAEEIIDAQALAVRAKRNDLFHLYQDLRQTEFDAEFSFVAWFLHVGVSRWVAFPDIYSEHDVDLELPPPPVPFPNGH